MNTTDIIVIFLSIIGIYFYIPPKFESTNIRENLGNEYDYVIGIYYLVISKLGPTNTRITISSVIQKFRYIKASE